MCCNVASLPAKNTPVLEFPRSCPSLFVSCCILSDPLTVKLSSYLCSLLTLPFLFQWFSQDRHCPFCKHTHIDTHFLSLSALISTSPPFSLSPPPDIPPSPWLWGLTGYMLSMLLGHGGPDSSDFCHSELALPPSSHLLTATPKPNPTPPPTPCKCLGLWLTPTHSLTLQRHIADSPWVQALWMGSTSQKVPWWEQMSTGRWMQETKGAMLGFQFMIFSA